MLWTALLLAHAGMATLHVGVHRDAGAIREIAAEGESGQCVVGPATISCPATGPVRFSWHGDASAVLVGSPVVEPGDVGRAWVLARPELREAELAVLVSDTTAQDVLAVFAPAPGGVEPMPSLEMIRALEALTQHPDPLVRRATIDGLVPFVRHTASDPFDAMAPELLDSAWIVRLAQDADVRVRRRLANRLKEVIAPDVAQADSAREALTLLLADSKPAVQRAAMVTSKNLTAHGLLAGEVTWERAMARVMEPGPPGRAAAGTLAFLATTVSVSETVDPTLAVSRVLAHHPERTWGVWSAWRTEVPARLDWMLQLFTTTSGLDRRLVRHWAKADPERLAEAIRKWEPSAPHSERFAVVQAWLVDAESKAVRSALQLPPKAQPGAVDGPPDPDSN